MRKETRGIFYYPMEVDHNTNKKIRLLFNDQNADGYWIWSCIVSQAYAKEGYFLKALEEDIDHLSAVICSKPPELILQVIESCLKRRLFDKEIFEKFSVLTSDRMQINYVRGTSDRRRKGGKIYFDERFFLIPKMVVFDMGEAKFNNVFFSENGENVYEKITAKTRNSAENSEIPRKTQKFHGKSDDFRTKNENENETTNSRESISSEKVLLPDGNLDQQTEFYENNFSVKNPSQLASKIGAKKNRAPRQKKDRSVELKIFNDLKNIWWEWFMSRNKNVTPKFNGASGKAIKQLSEYFISRAKKKGLVAESEILNSSITQFKYILGHWEELKQNNFLYNSTDVRKINSNINDIINFFNNGQEIRRNNKSGRPGNKSDGAEQLVGILKSEIATHGPRE
jgi:hypothetical protein